MAHRFRGGGRGRGRGRGAGSSFRAAKQEPFVLFPADVELPNIPNVSEQERNLIRWKGLLEQSWKQSPYYLQQKFVNSSNQVSEIERYLDKVKPEMQSKREPLSCFLKLTSSYFPVELIQGSKRVKHKENLLWDLQSEQKALDLFEKLEEKRKGQDEKDENIKKEGDNENEEEDKIEEEEEEDSDDNDYYQNIDFDDDEDDLNLDEGDADDEPCFD